MDGKRFAWVIGVSSYMESPLPKGVQDAESIKNTLTLAGFEVLWCGKDPDIEELHIRKNKLKEMLHPGLEIVLFYFSGHGLATANEQFLVPKGSLSNIQDLLEIKTFHLYNHYLRLFTERRFDSVKKWIWIDACREDAFADGQNITIQLHDAVQQNFLPPNTVIFYGTYPKKFSFEGSPDVPTSFFTTALLENIPIRELDSSDFIKRVIEQVRKKTRGEQVPISEGNFLKSDFYFYPPMQKGNVSYDFESEFEKIVIELQSPLTVRNGLKSLYDKVNQFIKVKNIEVRKLEAKLSFLPQKDPTEFSDEQEEKFIFIFEKAYSLLEEVKSCCMYSEAV